MTIDERLERLAERHQALAESVQSLLASVHEQGRNIQEQGRTVDKILIAIKADSENIAALARIAQSHENRLEKLEE